MSSPATESGPQATVPDTRNATPASQATPTAPHLSSRPPNPISIAVPPSVSSYRSSSSSSSSSSPSTPTSTSSITTASSTLDGFPLQPTTRTRQGATGRPSAFEDPDAHRDQADDDPAAAPLWCEFGILTGCRARFDHDSVRDWISHHVHRHYPRHHLPHTTVCWFCDVEPFSCDGEYRPRQQQQLRRQQQQQNHQHNHQQREAVFEARMLHIAAHIRDEGRVARDVRPDFFMLRHAYEIGIVGRATFEAAMSYSEVPRPRGLVFVDPSLCDDEPEKPIVIISVAGGRERIRRRYD